VRELIEPTVNRYEEEVRMGLHSKKAKAKAESKGKKRGSGGAGELGGWADVAVLRECELKAGSN
jgi:hypothetical protein